MITLKTDTSIVHLTAFEFRKATKDAIQFAINEKEYDVNKLTVNFIAEDITGRFGDIEKELPIIARKIISDELTKEKYLYV